MLRDFLCHSIQFKLINELNNFRPGTSGIRVGISVLAA